MPRVSRKQSEANREAICDAAARLFRERGLQGISVAEVMSAAGLTHGGFYGHFDSKEALAAQACSRAFEQAQARWAIRHAPFRKPSRARRATVDHHLSASSRDAPGESCPVVGFAGDVAREPDDSPLREAYTGGLKTLLAEFTALTDSKHARRQALADFSMMIGALVLARATRGDALSEELLDAARKTLHAQDRS